MIRAASYLPCPVGWLRSPLESALGWIALPFVQSMTGVSPDTAASVERLHGTVRGLESVLARLQTETTSRRAQRSRQWRRRLAALEAAAEADRTRAAALDAQVIALRAEVATLPALATELAALRSERTRWNAVTGDLTRQLDEAAQRGAADRARRQADAAAHVEAIDAGWRARFAALDRDGRARMAEAATRADQAHARIGELEAALALAHHRADTLQEHAETAAAGFAAERDALQAGRTELESVAAHLTHQLHEVSQHAAADRTRQQQDAAAHVQAVEAGWRARLTTFDSNAAALIAGATAVTDQAHARIAELEAALALAHRRADTLRDDAGATAAAVAADRDALQAALQAAAAREQGLAAQALQLEAALAEVVSHADVRERAAAQRWQAWGEEVEARVARERLRLATALDERQHQITALARALDDARATYESETRRRAADHDQLAAAAGELEVQLATAQTQVEMERRSHDSALTDAYQTLTQREQDLEQMRQRAQRLETARAAAVQELRALRAELESRHPGAVAATAPAPAGDSGAGTMAGAISRLLKSGAGRTGPASDDDESESS